jgi:hypothetical protein
LRSVVLGETVAPFRLLSPALCVVPVLEKEILDADAALDAGYRHLSRWLRYAEAKWSELCSKRIDGTPRMTLVQQLDYMRKLSAQLAVQGPRLVYAKAGTLLAATVVEDATIIIDHMAYWAPLRSPAEGNYLSAIINSEIVRERIAPMQAKGQGGARHFDNLVWELPIPDFESRQSLHIELVAAAVEAAGVAASVVLGDGDYFTRKRRAIRDALAADGIAARIDKLVVRLLDD